MMNLVISNTGRFQTKEPTKVFIRINALMVDLCDGLNAADTYFNLKAKQREVKIERFLSTNSEQKQTIKSFLELPPQRDAITFINKLQSDERFYPCFFSQVYEGFPECVKLMKEWLYQYFGEDYCRDRTIFYNHFFFVDKGIIIENKNSLWADYDFTGVHFKVGSLDSPNWESLEKKLFLSINDEI